MHVGAERRRPLRSEPCSVRPPSARIRSRLSRTRARPALWTVRRPSSQHLRTTDSDGRAPEVFRTLDNSRSPRRPRIQSASIWLPLLADTCQVVSASRGDALNSLSSPEAKDHSLPNACQARKRRAATAGGESRSTWASSRGAALCLARCPALPDQRPFGVIW